MNAHAAPAAASDSAADAAEQARLAAQGRHMEALDGLIDLGMGMVKALAAQVAGTGPQVVEGDVALAYARFSRAVRQGILLQTHLLAEPEETAKPEPKGRGGFRSDAPDDKDIYVTWMEPDDSKREGRRERVAQIVERMASAGGESPEGAERLYTDVLERLERVDLYGDLAARPVSEVLAEICRDLGLKPDWTVLSAQPWARQEIARGQKSREEGGEEVGWPLKDGPPPPEGWRGRWPPKAFPPWATDDAFPHKRNRPPAMEWTGQKDASDGAGWPDTG